MPLQLNRLFQEGNMSSAQETDIFPFTANRFNCIGVKERKIKRYDIGTLFARVSWPPPVLSIHPVLCKTHVNEMNK
jgi:hypothetical protein